MSFIIEERERKGKVVIVELSGRLTMGDGHESVSRFLQELVAKGERAVLLDMAGVPMMDSRGIQALVHGFTSLRNRGGMLKLVNLTPRVREVLDYTRLLTVFEAFDDEDAAVKSFS
jgi:anti-sigma B factor antagonist